MLRNYETISAALAAMRNFTRENSTFIARKVEFSHSFVNFSLLGRHFPPHFFHCLFGVGLSSLLLLVSAPTFIFSSRAHRRHYGLSCGASWWKRVFIHSKRLNGKFRRKRACKTYLLLLVHLKLDADSAVCFVQRTKSFLVVHSWLSDALALILYRTESTFHTFRFTFPFKIHFFLLLMQIFLFFFFSSLSPLFFFKKKLRAELNKKRNSTRFSRLPNAMFHLISLVHAFVTQVDHA